MSDLKTRGHFDSGTTSTQLIFAALSVCTVLVFSVAATPLHGKEASMSPATGGLRWDLSEAEYDPPDTPGWARVSVPDNIKPYKGKNGLPQWHPIYQRPGSTCGGAVAGIDRYQANHYVVYRDETAEFIYNEYTPLDAGYIPGTLPGYERVVEQYTDASMSETEKALALLKDALPDVSRHPGAPPLFGGPVAPDRALMDEELLSSGGAWCNEQARVYIRLCQVAGLQGRLVHLGGQSHTTAEVHADGQWILVDVSFHFVARDENGRLLSAAECHDRGPGQRAWAEAKKARYRQIAEMPDEWLNVQDAEHGERVRQTYRDRGSQERLEALAVSDEVFFSVINNPLPSSSAEASN